MVRMVESHTCAPQVNRAANPSLLMDLSRFNFRSATRPAQFAGRETKNLSLNPVIFQTGGTIPFTTTP
jgi:hypothetical protein